MPDALDRWNAAHPDLYVARPGTIGAEYVVALTAEERQWLLEAVQRVKHETEHPTVRQKLENAQEVPYAPCGAVPPRGVYPRGTNYRCILAPGHDGAHDPGIEAP